MVNKLYLDNFYINNIQQEINNLNFKILKIAKEKLNIKWATRIKVNKLFPQKVSEKQVQHLWHQDKINKGYISLIYYVNDSDGDTIVGGYKNTPKAGEMIYFDSDLFHRPSLPTKNERIIINFVFEKGCKIWT